MEETVRRYLLTLADDKTLDVLADELDLPAGETPFQHARFFIADGLVFSIAIGALVSVKVDNDYLP